MNVRSTAHLIPVRLLLCAFVVSCSGGPSGPPTPDPELDPDPPAPVADHLAFVAEPSDTPLGVAFAQAIRIEVRDSDGAHVSTADSDIEVVLESSSGDGTLRGPTAGRASNGVLTLSGLWMDGSGTYRLRASSDGLDDALSDEFEISYSFRFLESGWHTCAATTGSLVLCWGHNSFGELQTGGDPGLKRPIRLQQAETLDTLVSGGFHTCGLQGGTAYCFGYNDEGQLGNGDKGNAVTTLQRVGGNHVFTAIAAGRYHTCALDADGTAWCWGYLQGKLSDDHPEEDATEPVQVPAGVSFSTIEAGAYRTCGLTPAGNSLCWGLGLDASEPASDETWIPHAIPGGHTFRTVSAGLHHVCGIDTADVAWCWGTNYDGRLGDGSETFRPEPVQVGGALSLQSISAGDEHTCGLTPNGVAYCWGSNGHGELGVGEAILQAETPQPVAGDLRFQSLTAAHWHTCGLTVEGQAYCWGDNFYGYVGTDSSQGTVYTPVAVAEPIL